MHQCRHCAILCFLFCILSCPVWGIPPESRASVGELYAWQHCIDFTPHGLAAHVRRPGAGEPGKRRIKRRWRSTTGSLSSSVPETEAACMSYLYSNAQNKDFKCEKQNHFKYCTIHPSIFKEPLLVAISGQTTSTLSMHTLNLHLYWS